MFLVMYCSKQGKPYKYMFYLSFFVTIFSVSMTTEKAPVVWLLLQYILTYTIAKKHSKIEFTLIFKILFVLIAVITITDIMFMGSGNVSSALLSVASRAFAGSIQPAYHYLEIFPAKEAFKHGTTFPNPGGLLPFTPYELTKNVMNIVNPADSANGVVGTMPTIFWGEAYANFGVLGVVVVSLCVGTYVKFLDNVFNSIRLTAVSISFYTWLIMHLKDLSVTGFSDYVFDVRLVILAFIITSVYLIVYKLRFKL